MGNERPVGEILKELRTEKRSAIGKEPWAQEDVAKQIGCTAKTYRSWEKNNALPSTTYLLELADLYEVDCDYLLGRMEETTHDLNFICEKTGLSERTAAAFIEDPTLAEALGYLDRDELHTLMHALHTTVDEIVATVAFINRNDPDEQWLAGVQRMKLERSVYQFQEECRALINNWCDLEKLLSVMKKREATYFAYLEEQEKTHQEEIDELKRLPKPTIEINYPAFLKSLEDSQEAKDNG